jgi:uncharacterized membrane protein
MAEGNRAAESDTGRLETFSDGVFAIAITLLILDVRVPHVESGLGSALLHLWPNYVGYVVSFLTIGVLWINHHRMFRLIRRTDHTFLVLNTLFLLVVAFVPFPTALVAEYIRVPSERTVAAVAYGLTGCALAVMFNVLWRYAASRDHHLLVDGLDREVVRQSTRQYTFGPIVYAVLTVLALFAPLVSLTLFAALVVFYTFPSRFNLSGTEA